MHDALINSKPHVPWMYDLAQDYTDFSGTHHLMTSYLDSLSLCIRPVRRAEDA